MAAYDTVPDRVLHIASENVAGFTRRAMAWVKTNIGGELVERFKLLPTRVDLTETSSEVYSGPRKLDYE